ncbi:MAG: hypothetical protein H6822_21800 [Planctomycetaceae bacterium]|nr:hypothetical protein [Planctomycetales bacterium]MCB9924831.1 hypothetical protein [Planctomycetaceae bacterium]
MKNLILAAVAVLLLSAATSTAMADHFRRQHVYHHYDAGVHYVAPVVPYHVYHRAPAYVGPHYIYDSPRYYQHHHTYHYARPGYSTIGVYGGNYSVYIGF